MRNRRRFSFLALPASFPTNRPPLCRCRRRSCLQSHKQSVFVYLYTQTHTDSLSLSPSNTLCLPTETQISYTIGSIKRTTCSIFYSLLCLNQLICFYGPKYVYSVISVIEKRLRCNTKKWILVRSWTVRVRTGCLSILMFLAPLAEVIP